MKSINSINTKYSMLLLLIAIMALTTSCEKWTQVESIDIASPDLEQQNPELYERYLADLRNYKNSAHKINMGWFDNSKKITSSQGEHFSMVPDSLDFVVLSAPLDLVDREVNDMNSLLTKKSTKVLFEIDFNSIKTDFMLAEGLTVTFEEFLTDTVNTIFSNVKNYPYQGLVLSYMGKDLLHLTEEEKAIVKAEESMFFGLVVPQVASTGFKSFFFKGSPQYVNDKTVFGNVNNIILPTAEAADKGELSYTLASALVQDVPTDKFIVLASMTSYKADEAKLGYFANGERAALVTAEWAAGIQNGIALQGIGYTNLQYDYYNILKTYQFSREAIQLINPSAKQN